MWPGSKKAVRTVSPCCPCLPLFFPFPLTSTFCLHVVSVPTWLGLHKPLWLSWSYLFLPWLCSFLVFMAQSFLLSKFCGDESNVSPGTEIQWPSRQSSPDDRPWKRDISFLLKTKNITTKEDIAHNSLYTVTHSINVYK